MGNRNDPEPPFALTEGDKNSSLWKRLEEHFKNELEKARARNDGPLDPVTTANIRGQIKTYRALLSLGQE